MDTPDLNPYASPVTENIIQVAEIVDGGMWRDNKLLVVRKMAVFPDRCVKSNQPTNRRLKRKLAWHHPAVYLTILASLLIYVILALCLQKRAVLHVGLSDPWFRKRRRAIVLGWLGVLCSVGLWLAAITVQGDENLQISLMLSGVALFFTAATFGALASRMVAATKIDNDFVWLKGVCPEFLADLPQWPK
ncbi:MAG: hypothetical protein KDA87_01505 [Planctomycetales bacterium]|nr:hypothetical protein [Planctomycetales bacterium]